jgi:hypothetical protein
MAHTQKKSEFTTRRRGDEVPLADTLSFKRLEGT